MFNYFGVSRRLSKSLRDALKERDYWRTRADTLAKKLEDRTDFFVEREFKLVDRFLTSQVKTFAITDEVKASKITDKDVNDAALTDFLADKKAFLVDCAKEAGLPDPESAAQVTYDQNYSSYVLEFQSQ